MDIDEILHLKKEFISMRIITSISFLIIYFLLTSISYSKNELVITDEVINDWTNKANNGDVISQSNLGRMYKDLKKYDQALYWWEKASNNNDARAQYGLGVMYLQGLGVEKNIKKGFEYKLKSAENGHLSAEYDVAVIYLNGIDGYIDKNIDKGILYLDRAAKKDHPHAQYNLGLIYIYGIPGFPPQEDRKKEACKFIDRAREQDSSLIWDIYNPKLKWY